MNFRKLVIVDSSASLAAEKYVTEDDIMDLYINGSIVIDRPLDIPYKEFAEAVRDRIEENWGEPEVGFSYGPLNLKISLLGDKVVVNNHGN